MKFRKNRGHEGQGRREGGKDGVTLISNVILRTWIN